MAQLKVGPCGVTLYVVRLSIVKVWTGRSLDGEVEMIKTQGISSLVI